jgi:multiple sugar transport system permease protein
LSSSAVTSDIAGVTHRRGPRRSWRGALFVLPYLPLLIIFGIAPTVYAVILAFTNVGGSFVWFRNFVHTYNDFRFIDAFKHVLIYTAVWLVALMVFVVGLALLLHGRANRVSTSFRFLFYIPGALAGAASVVIWLFMLDPSVSPGSFILDGVLGSHSFAQSIAAENLPFIFAMMAFWTGAGGWIVVMYGALNTIPHELEEAARIDGAGPIAIALRVKLPLIKKWVAYMLILSFATGTQLFVEPQILQSASFGLVPDTWSANQLAYQLAFRYADFNGAAAIAVDLLAIGLIGAVIVVTRSGLFRTED